VLFSHCDQSGKRRRPAPRCLVAAVIEDASPIARRACRASATREGEEAYSESREARQRKKAVLARESIRALDRDKSTVLEKERAAVRIDPLLTCAVRCAL
jgi:hypothetical protein